MHWIAAAGVLVLALLTACDDDPGSTDTPMTRPTPTAAPIAQQWTSTRLPTGAGESAVLRDGTWCGDHWLVVGAERAADGTTRPAAWRSPDGRAWRSVPIHPRSYYGRRAILHSVACVGQVPVAVGAMSGGAHGNARVSTFRSAGGTWTDVRAPFEQYGGPDALNVGPVASGADGWLIAGNRLSGPAVWVARSPRRFTIVEAAARLSNGPDDIAIASQAAWYRGAWHVVGGESVGANRVPRAWTSRDGRTWQRDDVPSDSPLDDLVRVVATDDGLVAVGRVADGFGVWRSDGTSWSRQETFATDTGTDGSGLPDVLDLDASGDALYAVVTDGTDDELWSSDGAAWQRVALPVEVAPSGDTSMALAASAHGVLLLTDDGTTAMLWQPVDVPADGESP
ncbi:hypothetical protein [Nocardioides sp. MH1]|uniref:hypothetical protein n=1 Tax=Nocardioides sp. MH1 TaxID=3242490 RepID=UPI003522ADB5